MSSNPYVYSLFVESARLFGAHVERLFQPDSRDQSCPKRDAECAIAYTLWIAQSTESLSNHLGREIDIMSKVTACLRKRKQDPRYDRLVSELVWFAQRVALTGRAA